MCFYLYQPERNDPVTLKFAKETIFFRSTIAATCIVDLLVKNTTEDSIDKLLLVYPRPFRKPRKTVAPTDDVRFYVRNGTLYDARHYCNTLYYRQSDPFSDFKKVIENDDEYENEFDIQKLTRKVSLKFHDYSDIPNVDEDTKRIYDNTIAQGNFSLLRLDFTPPLEQKDYALIRLEFVPVSVAIFETETNIYWLDQLWNRLFTLNPTFQFRIACPYAIKKGFLDYLNTPQSDVPHEHYNKGLLKQYIQRHKLTEPGPEKLKVERYEVNIWPSRFKEFDNLSPEFTMDYVPVGRATRLSTLKPWRRRGWWLLDKITPNKIGPNKSYKVYMAEFGELLENNRPLDKPFAGSRPSPLMFYISVIALVLAVLALIR